MSCYVFLGPSLPRAAAAEVLDAVWLPPVRQGDVLRLVLETKPRLIGVIDGCFGDTPACWHKEILYAIAQGVHVFGGSSMGALRAAELDAYGMVGVGTVYAAYRSGRFPGWPDDPFEADDEVAVLHGPWELGCPALSEPLVNIRASLAEAVAQDVLPRPIAATLLQHAKATFYPERNYARLATQARDRGLPEHALDAWAAWLLEHAVDIKRADALATLQAMRAFLETNPPSARAGFRFEASTAWEAALTAVTAPSVLPADEGLDGLILDEARLQPELAGTLRRQAVERLCALMLACGESGAPVKTGAAVLAFRQERGLLRRRELEAWQADAGLTDLSFERLMESEARIEALVERMAPEAAACMLDLLRLRDEYAALRARAEAKSQMLQGLAVPELDDPAARELVSWHAVLTGLLPPSDIDRYARALGFCDGEDLARALWRERAWQQRQGAARMASGNCPAGPR